MSGTKAGGKKCAATNKKLHGSDFYARIGAKGGRNGHTGGFAADPERARIAGAKGGRKSSRAGVANGEGKTPKRKPKKTQSKKAPKTTPKAKKVLKEIRESGPLDMHEFSYIEIEPKKKGLFSRMFGRKNG